MAALAADALGLAKEDIIVASTEGSDDEADAIMTTDLKKKEPALQFTLGGKTVRMAAIAKGSGMIRPNMAAMLSFFTTDAAISPDMLQKALSGVVTDTYD